MSLQVCTLTSPDHNYGSKYVPHQLRTLPFTADIAAPNPPVGVYRRHLQLKIRHLPRKGGGQRYCEGILGWIGEGDLSRDIVRGS
jgi:hypothetical protein